MFGDSQELAENKLLLLYIFEKIQSPVSNTRITELVLENNLINYFHLQQYLSELVSSGFLDLNREDKRILYSVTPKGKNALEYFENRIAQPKKDLINKYLDNLKPVESSNLQIIADYFPSSQSGYLVTCRINENKVNIIDLKLNVKSVEQAKSVCAKWKVSAPALYDSITRLFND